MTLKDFQIGSNFKLLYGGQRGACGQLDDTSFSIHNFSLCHLRMSSSSILLQIVNLAAVTNIWSITKIFNSPKMNQENVQKEKMGFRGDGAIFFIGVLLYDLENNILSWKNVPLIFFITSRSRITLDKFISLIGNAWLSNSHIPHTFSPIGSLTSLIFGYFTKSRRWGWSYWQISPLWICQTQDSLSIITILKEFCLLPTPIGWCSKPFFPEINCQLSSINFFISRYFYHSELIMTLGFMFTLF